MRIVIVTLLLFLGSKPVAWTGNEQLINGYGALINWRSDCDVHLQTVRAGLHPSDRGRVAASGDAGSGGVPTGRPADDTPARLDRDSGSRSARCRGSRLPRWLCASHFAHWTRQTPGSCPSRPSGTGETSAARRPSRIGCRFARSVPASSPWCRPGAPCSGPRTGACAWRGQVRRRPRHDVPYPTCMAAPTG